MILLDSETLQTSGEFERILIHEIFHFAWVRLSNYSRRDWERVLESEIRRRANGELGWSAEWRKQKLTSDDRSRRSRAWRLYCCESFCDSAAFLFAGLQRHDEFTLARSFRQTRAQWFRRNLPSPLPV